MNTSEKFSPREQEVIDLLMLGKSNKQIALSLGVSERTVEFHLKNIYAKMRVGSRVELILKLGKTHNLVESTVDFENGKAHNGSQVWRNLISLIKKEVAVTIKISFTDIENYLRRHPDIFSLLVFVTASAMIRYVLFGIGLFFGGSYILLELLLLFGAVYLGRTLNGISQFRSLGIVLMAGVLPLLVAGLDKLYLHTILRYTDSIKVLLPYLSSSAEWLKAPDGTFYLVTQFSMTSEFVWFVAMGEMVIAFFLSRMFGKHSGKDSFVTA